VVTVADDGLQKRGLTVDLSFMPSPKLNRHR
jgi:hypothetical protein